MEYEYEITNKVNDSLIKEMIKLDKVFFKGEDVGTLSKCKEWLSVNDDIYTVLLLNKKVIGYINFIPITDDFYEKFKAGSVRDSNLSKSDVLTFSAEKPLKCLFTSIALNKRFRKTLALQMLWIGFLKKIKSYNVVIDRVIMDCVTDIGEKCAIKHLGAKFIRKSSSGKIYEGQIKELCNSQ